MCEQNGNFLKKVLDLQQTEKETSLTDIDYNEIEEIENLRKIVLDLEDNSDWTYYTST